MDKLHNLENQEKFEKSKEHHRHPSVEQIDLLQVAVDDRISPISPVAVETVAVETVATGVVRQQHEHEQEEQQMVVLVQVEDLKDIRHPFNIIHLVPVEIHVHLL